ncbi:endonuclease VII domain-containing protein [Pseudomonas aeruginosa]|uniref:endonuclease VII domain-containing protein n=1 Tax=Pseudomonas aeruginosa TaxID=287 RepID=UPI002F3F98F1
MRIPCRKCGEEKDIEDFSIRTDTGKRRTECRSCRSQDNLNRYHNRASTKDAHSKASLKHYLRKRYGMTVEQYEQMSAAQDHKCAICHNPETQHRRLAVDHCHATGRVRALLCQSCNTALGKLRDDPSLMRRAAEYIERHSSERAYETDS